MKNIDMEQMGIATYFINDKGYFISSAPRMMFPGYYGYDLNLKVFFEHLNKYWDTQLLNNENVDAFKCLDEMDWRMPKALAKLPIYYLGEPVKENGRNFVLLKNKSVKLPIRHFDFVFDKTTGNILFGKEEDFWAQLESSMGHQCGYTHRYPEIDMLKMCRITEDDLEWGEESPNYIVPEGMSYGIHAPVSLDTLMNGYQMLEDKIANPSLSDEEALARYEQRALLLEMAKPSKKEIPINAIYVDKAEEIKDFSQAERKAYLIGLLNEIKELKTIKKDQHPADNIQGILGRMVVFDEHKNEFSELMNDAYLEAIDGINKNVNVWRKSVIPSRRESMYENIFLSLTSVKNEGYALIKETEDYIDLKGLVEGDITIGYSLGDAKPGLKNNDTFLPLHVKLILDAAQNVTYLDNEKAKPLIRHETVSKQMTDLLKDTWVNPDLTSSQPITDAVAKVMGDYVIETAKVPPREALYMFLNEDILRFHKKHIAEYFDGAIEKATKGNCIDVHAIPAAPLRLMHHMDKNRNIQNASHTKE